MISIETRKDLTLFHLSGEMTTRDILDHAVNHIMNDPTPMALWNLSEVSRLRVTVPEVKAGVDELKIASAEKEPRIVALVGFGEVNMGIAKIFIAFSQIAGLKHRYRVFRRIEYALSWLESQRIA